MPEPAASQGVPPAPQTATSRTASGAAGRPVVTLAAVGVLVVIGARLLHEVLGHGVPCLLGGGEWRGFSTTWTVCADAELPSRAQGLQLAGGTLVQLCAGLLALGVLRMCPPSSGLGYAALWQAAAVNLFLATGPLMIDPITGGREWGDVLRLHLTAPAWRWGGMAVGLGLTVWGYLLLLRLLEPLLATAPSRRRALARAVSWSPFLVGVGIVLPLAALRNVLGPGVALAAIMTAVGATSFLFWIPLSVAATPPQKPPPWRCTPVRDAPVLWVLALVVAALTIWLVGPGVPLSG